MLKSRLFVSFGICKNFMLYFVRIICDSINRKTQAEENRIGKEVFGMRMKNMLKCAGILGVLVLCTACGGQQVVTEKATGENVEQANYIRCEGVTAVATQDSTLTNCVTLHENDTAETGKVVYENADDQKVKAGDNVLFLHEDSQNPDMVHVMISNGDNSNIYGYIAKENVNKNAENTQSVKDIDTWHR